MTEQGNHLQTNLTAIILRIPMHIPNMKRNGQGITAGKARAYAYSSENAMPQRQFGKKPPANITGKPEVLKKLFFCRGNKADPHRVPSGRISSIDKEGV